MTRLLPLLFLSVLAGCGVSAPEPYPVVICHATKDPIQCPTEEGDGIRAVQVFSEHVLYLADDEPLEIHWYDWDEPFDETGDVSGYTETHTYPTRVHVRNTGVMMHELTHVALYRATGNADANHEQPPGPWGPALNLAIEQAADSFGTTNGVSVPGVTDHE